MSPIRNLAVESFSSSRDKTISIHMINIWSMISEMLLENLRNIIVMIIGRNSNVVLIWCYSLKKGDIWPWKCTSNLAVNENLIWMF